MVITLAEAPIGAMLIIEEIVGLEFASRLSRLGLYAGASIRRLPQETAIGPAKVRGTMGDVTLSGWLAGYIVIHRDDDCRLPLLECEPGATGHVEGISGQTFIEDSLQALGIREGDRITLLRRLPPMLYQATVNGKQNVAINEVMAAHILGETAGEQAQFSSVGKGEIFTVKKILCGEDADVFLAGQGIIPGVELVLSKVSTRQNISIASSTAIACVTSVDLSLFLRERDAECIFVSLAGEQLAKR